AGVGQDHEQAVLLRLEVVVELGRSDPDVASDVGPLGALVAFAAESLGRRVDDRVELGAVVAGVGGVDPGAVPGVGPAARRHASSTSWRASTRLTISPLTGFSDEVRG